MMSAESSASRWSLTIALGAVWGVSEVALGIGLQACARNASGSIMTGVALFFIVAGWALTKKAGGPLIMIGMVSLLKLADALLLGLPIKHGAVANPIFAFWTEGLALLVLVALLRGEIGPGRIRQAMTGGLSALVAVNLFPLVKYATTIPACVYPGTTTPLALYYAPLAIATSMIMVPLGLTAAAKLVSLERKMLAGARARRLGWVYTPATVLLSLLLILLIRAV